MFFNKYSKYNHNGVNNSNNNNTGNNSNRNSNNSIRNNSNNNNSNSPKPFCPICKKNGKSEAEYNSHFIRETSDENSKITCPILLNMECNHCGEKGHIVAKCPSKKCVYCNEFGHTVSRCTAAPKDVIDNFLDDRHNKYVDRKDREQQRDNIFQRREQAAAAVAPVAKAVKEMPTFDDSPSLCKPKQTKAVTEIPTFDDSPSLCKPKQTTSSTASAPAIFNYSNVAKIAASIPEPKKSAVVVEKPKQIPMCVAVKRKPQPLKKVHSLTKAHLTQRQYDYYCINGTYIDPDTITIVSEYSKHSSEIEEEEDIPIESEESDVECEPDEDW